MRFRIQGRPGGAEGKEGPEDPRVGDGAEGSGRLAREGSQDDGHDHADPQGERRDR